MVKNALRLFSHDQTGLADYALESGGDKGTLCLLWCLSVFVKLNIIVILQEAASWALAVPRRMRPKQHCSVCLEFLCGTSRSLRESSFKWCTVFVLSWTFKKKKCDWMTDNPHTVDAKNHYFIVDIVFNDLGSNAIHLTWWTAEQCILMVHFMVNGWILQLLIKDPVWIFKAHFHICVSAAQRSSWELLGLPRFHGIPGDPLVHEHPPHCLLLGTHPKSLGT